MQSYSRISKFQQQKIIRQSLVLLLFTIVAITVFVLVLLPALVRIMDSLGKRAPSPTENEQVIPPQTPILFPTPDATNSAEISLSGYAQTDTTVTLYNNSVRVQEVSPNTDGQFVFQSITLTEGDNDIYVLSRTDKKSEAKSAQHLIVLDTKPPTLTITSPTDKTTITRRREQSLSILGTTEPKTRVYIQDKLVFTNNQGNFSGQYQLGDGENVLKIRALDAAGNSTESTLTVYFKP